jgi:hypothetical protein
MEIIMDKQSQTSLIDFLRDMVPELQHFTFLVRPDPVSDPNAKALYEVWSDVENKIADRKFVRPPTMSQSQIAKLESSGLVEIQGKYLKVTSKGAEAIKSIILQTEKSAFNKSASQNIKLIKEASRKNVEVYKNNWYSRIK